MFKDIEIAATHKLFRNSIRNKLVLLWMHVLRRKYIILSIIIAMSIAGLCFYFYLPKSMEKFGKPDFSNVNQVDSKLKAEVIVDATRFAWYGYRLCAWGSDHLCPDSCSGENTFQMGLTILDSLDTLFLMGLTEEYNQGRKWVEQNLTWEINTQLSVFEVTIRALGGLLSIYHLSNDELFLNKAYQLGLKLLPAFNTSKGLPASRLNLKFGIASSLGWTTKLVASEINSLQLEFVDLSRSTKNSTFELVATKVSKMFHSKPKYHGLANVYLEYESGDFDSHSAITMGGLGDSYYEYLLKQWIQTGKRFHYLIQDYKNAINGMKTLLLKSSKNDLLFIGSLVNGKFVSKMEHLACFAPGTLALGVLHGMPHEHLDIAEKLLYTCYQMYTQTKTNLSPEQVYFKLKNEVSGKDIVIREQDAFNLLRPEFIESLWYMSRAIPRKREKYQRWGWKVFEAINSYSKRKYGYSSMGKINSLEPVTMDKMETFFMAETLKYLYLLFKDPLDIKIDLDKYVLNTEAHFLPIRN